MKQHTHNIIKQAHTEIGYRLIKLSYTCSGCECDECRQACIELQELETENGQNMAESQNEASIQNADFKDTYKFIENLPEKKEKN